jgi:DNA-binding HxlR family transcriptional regulator
VVKRYEQYCPMAHALDLVGDRWALLVIRELMHGPKRYTDLVDCLPGIGTNILAARLRDLEGHDIVARRILPPPAASKVYELTDYGRELDDILMALGRWGAQSMGQPDPDDIYTAGSLMMAMRSAYQAPSADSAKPTSVNYELRVTDVVLSLTVRDGELGISDGPQADPDLVIETEHGFAALLMGQITPAEAIESGSVRVVGDPELLTEFANTFRV